VALTAGDIIGQPALFWGGLLVVIISFIVGWGDMFLELFVRKFDQI